MASSFSRFSALTIRVAMVAGADLMQFMIGDTVTVLEPK